MRAVCHWTVTSSSTWRHRWTSSSCRMVSSSRSFQTPAVLTSLPSCRSSCFSYNSNHRWCPVPDCFQRQLTTIINTTTRTCLHSRSTTARTIHHHQSTTTRRLLHVCDTKRSLCVRNFHRNFMISWFVTVCVCDFHDLCPWPSPWESFVESRRNGIWA